MKARVLELRGSPHLSSGRSVESIMFNVVLALLPVTGFAVYAYGLAALATLSTSVFTCVIVEHVITTRAGKRTAVTDWSAVITGLLYGLTLPPGLPLWMNAAGAAIAIVLGKHLFGGLGFNTFNPALVGRAILQAAFPVPMTTWLAPFAPDRFGSLTPSLATPPFTEPLAPDVVSGATPLAAWKFEGQVADTGELMMGYVSGSTGEAAALLILAGGAWLVARRMMNGRITVAILATVAAMTALLHGLAPDRYPDAGFMLMSGGLMLGATFMATDMVGSPMTNLGCVIYGVLIGALIVVIRLWGGMPEGVMYAILLGNALTPHIDNLIRPRVYGTGRALARARVHQEAAP